MLFGAAYIAASTAEGWQSLKEALPQEEAPRWGARLFGRLRRGSGAFDGSLAGYSSGEPDPSQVRDAWLGASSLAAAPPSACSWKELQSLWSPCRLAADMANGSSGSALSSAAIRRVTPGFLHQFYWSLGRAMLKRLREPLSIFSDYAIFALTGGWGGRRWGGTGLILIPVCTT